MGDKKKAYMILVGKRNRKLMLGQYTERGFSKNRTGMDWISGQAWTGFIWLMIGTSGELK